MNDRKLARIILKRMLTKELYDMNNDCNISLEFSRPLTFNHHLAHGSPLPKRPAFAGYAPGLIFREYERNRLNKNEITSLAN